MNTFKERYIYVFKDFCQENCMDVDSKNIFFTKVYSLYFHPIFFEQYYDLPDVRYLVTYAAI